MRAVLLCTYVVLLLAMASKGPAQPLEDSGQLAAVQATVNHNADTLASLTKKLNNVTQKLTSMNSMLHLVAHQYMSDSCTFNDLPYPDGSSVETVCRNQTCKKGEWIADSYDRYFNPLCCKLGGEHHPDGTTLERFNSCKPTCTRGKWINEPSSKCCEYKGAWYGSGTNINDKSGNRTCEDDIWNIILNNPELEFKLLTGNENVESISIKYTVYETESIGYWVGMLNEMIKPYEGGYDYYGGADVKDCSENNLAEDWQVCKFDYQMLGMHCTRAEEWGYTRGSPCVILKMSRKTGWTPAVYQSLGELPDDMPWDLREHITRRTDDYGGNVPKMVWVHCKNDAHEEYIPKIEYTPWMGFPAYYFPYMETPGYLDPIVSLRFVDLPSNVPINIECKAYAKNIVHNREQGLGIIRIQLKKIV